MSATEEQILEWIEEAGGLKSDPVRLAQVVSMAARVDWALLRRARLELLPGVDPGAEADLWAGPLVHSRGPDGFVLRAEVARWLQEKLAGDGDEQTRLEAAGALMLREHEHLPPALRLEERLTYWGLSRRYDEATLARELGQVVQALLDPGRRPLTVWVERALDRMPDRVQHLAPALVLREAVLWWSDIGSRTRSDTPASPMRDVWSRLIARRSDTPRPFLLRLAGGVFEIAPKKQGEIPSTAGPLPVEVAAPDTDPLFIEVGWTEGDERRIARIFPRDGDPVRLRVGTNIEVRFADGTGFAVQAAEPSSAVEAGPVHLRVEAPEVVRPGEAFLVRVLVTPAEEPPIVQKAMPGRRPRRPGIEGTVRLAGSDLDVHEAEVAFVWEGEAVALNFEVHVPADASPRTTALHVEVKIGGVVMAQRGHTLTVARAAKEPGSAETFRTAYAAYAAEDRERVLDRIAALRSIAGLDLFLDAPSVRTGENWQHVIRKEIEARDLFILFWSRNAGKSSWVEWEWRTALEVKGRDAIRPIALDPLREAPPPRELAGLHFEDAFSQAGARSHARLSARVSGRLQGVGFRLFVQRQAKELGLSGRANNEADGSVRVEAEGPRDALERLLEAVRRGPPGTLVEHVEVTWLETGDANGGFSVEEPPRTDLPQTWENGLGMRFVLIPAGTFQMGSDAKEASGGEQPVHSVTISRPFYLGVHVVRQRDWKAVMGSEPWKRAQYVEEGDDYPAVYVSWEDAQAFIEKLNAGDAESRYRLPTEAEWEYACRAGSSAAYSFGEDPAALRDYAWYDKNAWDVGERYAHRVGQKRWNGWGLYDMHGNVWEWVSDWYASEYYRDSPSVDPPGPETGSDRVSRGGSWSFPAGGARSAYRGGGSPGYRGVGLGFRLVRMAL